MKSGFHRRFAGALAISIVLHLMAILPLRLPNDSPADTQQIHLHATLSRTPFVAAPTAIARPPPDKKAPAPPARLLTAPSGTRQTEPPATPPEGEQSPVAPAEALVLDQPQLPEYPAAALAQGLEGCVLASVLVSAAGEVDSVSILAADHPGVFDASVVEAQKSARYAPARQGSVAVGSRVLAVASFVMQPGKQLDCPLKYAALAEQLVRGKAP